MKLILASARLAAIVFIALPLALVGLVLATMGGVLVGVAKMVKDMA